MSRAAPAPFQVRYSLFGPEPLRPVVRTILVDCTDEAELARLRHVVRRELDRHGADYMEEIFYHRAR